MNDERTRQTKPKHLQYSMRAVLIAMTLIAIGTLFYQRRVKVNWITEDVVEAGGKVEYYPDSMPWLNERTDDFFRHVKSIEFEREIKPEILADLHQLPHLESIDLTKANQESAKSIVKLAQRLPLKSLKINLGAFDVDQILTIAAEPDLKCTVVGEISFEQIDDRTLRLLSKLDTSQATGLQINNSNISAASMETVNDLNFKVIDFYNCPLTLEQIRPIDFDSLAGVIRIWQSDLAPEDFIEHFGPQSTHMEVRDLLILGKSAASYVSLDTKPETFSKTLFEQAPQLRTLKSSLTHPSLLTAIEHSQPALDLEFFSCRGTRLWETVAATPGLKGLTVWSVDKNSTVRFTEEHELESLIVGANQFSDSFFAEVGKLQKLESLTVLNLNELSTEIEPLTNLAQLKSLTINSLSPEAEKLVRKKNLESLTVNPAIYYKK